MERIARRGVQPPVGELDAGQRRRDQVVPQARKDVLQPQRPRLVIAAELVREAELGRGVEARDVVDGEHPHDGRPGRDQRHERPPPGGWVRAQRTTQDDGGSCPEEDDGESQRRARADREAKSKAAESKKSRPGALTQEPCGQRQETEKQQRRTGEDRDLIRSGPAQEEGCQVRERQPADRRRHHPAWCSREHA